MARRLAILATHPVQYFVPVFRGLAATPGWRCRVFVGCLHGVESSSYDPDFGLTFAWDCDLTSGYERRAITGWPLKALSGWRGVLAGGWAALRLLLWRPDAVLIYAYSPSFIATASLLLALARVRILLRADTSDEAYSRSAIKSWLRDAVLRRYYHCCRWILPIGAESYRHFQRLGVPSARLRTVPYAVDQAVIPPWEPEAPQQPQPGRLRLGFVGKFTPVKDPLILARALDHLSAGERERLSFAAAGDGPLLAACRAALEPLLPQCAFHGFLNQSDLPAFYRQIDLLLLPSVQGEVWGLVVNEALSHGVRVIVSDRVSSRHDLVLASTQGWVFPAGQSRALARAIRLALQAWPWLRCAHPTPSAQQLVAAVQEVLW
jgi:glycosyltransferase involved in cell wall biosynthesis